MSRPSPGTPMPQNYEAASEGDEALPHSVRAKHATSRGKTLIAGLGVAALFTTHIHTAYLMMVTYSATWRSPVRKPGFLLSRDDGGPFGRRPVWGSRGPARCALSPLPVEMPDITVSSLLSLP